MEAARSLKNRSMGIVVVVVVVVVVVEGRKKIQCLLDRWSILKRHGGG